MSKLQLAIPTSLKVRAAPAALTTARRSQPGEPDGSPDENVEGPPHEEPPYMGAERAPFTPEEWQEMVAEAAYYRAERRGFEQGYELDDWLEAEAEIRESMGSSA